MALLHWFLGGLNKSSGKAAHLETAHLKGLPHKRKDFVWGAITFLTVYRVGLAFLVREAVPAYLLGLCLGHRN